MRPLLFILSLFAFSASAQTSVEPYIPGTTTDGITYYLPTTRLHITITATRQSYTPGEYAPYAERYLRLSDIATEAYDTWTIKSVDVTPYGAANTQEAYTIHFKQKTLAPLVALAPDGVLLAINTDPEPLPTLTTPSIVNHPTKTFNATDYKTPEILSAGSALKMAELTAQEIYDIRENRSLLAKGQAEFMPKDGEQLRLMMTNLDEQEAALLSLFKGTMTEHTHVFTLDYLPTGDVQDEILCRFSKYNGLVEADDLSGEPIYITIKDQHTVPDEIVDPKAKKKEVEDVRYCNPSRASITLYNHTGSLASLTVPVAQFGKIEHLGGELFNKKVTTKITFWPYTGGIKSITN